LQRRLINLAAFFGQRESGAAALAQAQAEALFQIAHLLADRRAPDAEHGFRRREAAASTTLRKIRSRRISKSLTWASGSGRRLLMLLFSLFRVSN
jgi:hypothetical protein